MCKPLYSSYHQKGWQWKIIALEMQQKPRDGTSRVSTGNTSKSLQDKGKRWFPDTVVFLPVCKQQENMAAAAFPKQSRFLTLKLGRILYTCLRLNSQPDSANRSTFPSHTDYFIPEAELVSPKSKDNGKSRKRTMQYTGQGKSNRWKEEKKKVILVWTGADPPDYDICWIELLIWHVRMFTIHSVPRTCTVLSCPYPSHATR